MSRDPRGEAPAGRRALERLGVGKVDVQDCIAVLKAIAPTFAKLPPGSPLYNGAVLLLIEELVKARITAANKNPDEILDEDPPRTLTDEVEKHVSAIVFALYPQAAPTGGSKSESASERYYQRVEDDLKHPQAAEAGREYDEHVAAALAAIAAAPEGTGVLEHLKLQSGSHEEVAPAARMLAVHVELDHPTRLAIATIANKGGDFLQLQNFAVGRAIFNEHEFAALVPAILALASPLLPGTDQESSKHNRHLLAVAQREVAGGGPGKPFASGKARDVRHGPMTGVFSRSTMAGAQSRTKTEEVTAGALKYVAGVSGGEPLLEVQTAPNGFQFVDGIQILEQFRVHGAETKYLYELHMKLQDFVRGVLARFGNASKATKAALRGRIRAVGGGGIDADVEALLAAPTTDVVMEWLDREGHGPAVAGGTQRPYMPLSAAMSYPPPGTLHYDMYRAQHQAADDRNFSQVPPAFRDLDPPQGPDVHPYDLFAPAYGAGPPEHGSFAPHRPPYQPTLQPFQAHHNHHHQQYPSQPNQQQHHHQQQHQHQQQSRRTAGQQLAEYQREIAALKRELAAHQLTTKPTGGPTAQPGQQVSQ